MFFEHGHIYHIYNKGNNRQQIFFMRENYLFFLKKIETFPEESGSATLSRTPTAKQESFNKSIGIMLASYTRDINKQDNLIGSLFRDKTKAECLTKTEGNTPFFFNTVHGTKINVQIPEKEYHQVCFNYIHNNPVKANLADHPEDWEFSSYRDYCGLRNGKLINTTRAEEFGLRN